MRAALNLGSREQGETWPNPAVGALVVSPAGAIVGRGWTHRGGRPHAEPPALQEAGAAARGATLYVTLEPCSHHGRTPPCVNAIIAAGIGRVVSAMEDPDPRVAGRGHAILAEAGISVTIGVGLDGARRAHAGHVSRVTRGRPHVHLKVALSADERVAGPGGVPAAITAGIANGRVHMWRAQADAVLVGIGTVLADDPLLTCRLPGMADRSPVRVVLDTALRTPISSRLAGSVREAPLWIVAGPDAPRAAQHALAAAGARVLRVDRNPAGRLDLDAALQMLGAEGLTCVMVEAGPAMMRGFLDRDLVDSAALLRSPNRLGPDALGLAGEPAAAILNRAGLRLRDSAMAGPDRVDIYERQSCSQD